MHFKTAFIWGSFTNKKKNNNVKKKTNQNIIAFQSIQLIQPNCRCLPFFCKNIWPKHSSCVCWAAQEKSKKVDLIQVWGGFSWNPRGFRRLRLCHISAPSHPVDSKSRYKHKHRHKVCHISVQGDTLQSLCWNQIQIQKQRQMKTQLQKKTK